MRLLNLKHNTMKTLESITTSLEVSKKLDKALKSAGIKVEPLFWWCYDYMLSGKKYKDMRCSVIDNELLPITISYKKNEHIPALTASEIGAILSKVKYWSELRLAYVNVMDLTEDLIIPEQMMMNAMEQPDIGGEMLCYLIDNGLLNNN